MRLNRCCILLLLGMITTTAYSQKAPVPKGKRLRDIVKVKYPKGNVYVGGTTGWRKMEKAPELGVIMNREFHYATPQNDYKQSTVHPRPDVWKWKLADAWIKRCAKEKQIIRIHGPISPQCSKWTREDNRTAEELKQNLIEYTTALYKRYDKYEHVKWIDVVNETLLPNGSWHGPKPGTEKWENPWTKIGFDTSDLLKPPLYIKMAFEIAKKHAPNTKLIINQHGGMEEGMWKKIKALVPYLRKQGLRIDGIGWQAHIDVGWEKRKGNMERLSALIDWAHANKLSFHVTEKNVWLKGKKKDLNTQADTFAAIMRALLEKRNNGIVTWNVWNLSDASAWKKESKMEGCLFDRDYKAKPAYYALQKLLENPPEPKHNTFK